GMFNGLLAPILFVYVWEFNLAVIAACLIRPAMRESGWIDTFLAQNMGSGAAAPVKGKGPPRAQQAAEVNINTTRLLEFVLPGLVAVLTLILGLAMSTSLRFSFNGGTLFLAYGVPLALACLMLSRPLRFGLAIAGIIIVHAFDQSRYDTSEYADRSY